MQLFIYYYVNKLNMHYLCIYDYAHMHYLCIYDYEYMHYLCIYDYAFISFKHILNEFDVKNLSIRLLYCL